MIDGVRPEDRPEIAALWHDVVDDLQHVYDIHFVCSSFSYHVARHMQSRVLVALDDSDAQCYDLWITDPDGSTSQLKWTKSESGIQPLMGLAQPATLDKMDRPAAEILSGKLWLQTHQRLLVAPLVPTNRPYQAFPPVLLALIDPPDLDHITLQAVANVANLMCVFLDRAGLRTDVDRRTIEFAIVSDISQALSATLDIQQIYDLLNGPVRQVLNVETLSIALVEPVTGDIVFVDSLLGPRFSQLPTLRLKKGQGIAGWVAANQEPVVINNAYSDQRFYSGVDRSSGFRTHSMICIPLRVDDQTIGVFQVINRKSGRFTDRDLQLVQALAGPLAAAIENSNLHADVLAEMRLTEALFDAVPEGIITVNREGIITNANSAFGALIDLPVEEVIGLALRDIFRTRKSDIDLLIKRASETDQESVDLALEYPRQNGLALPLYIHGTPVRGDDEKIEEFVFIFTDLTQIQEVERMRDDLFDGVSHELGTPLATILMYSRLLQKGRFQQPDRAERFLGVIERESDRLQHMIQQLLAISRIKAKEMRRSPQPVLLNPLFDELLPAAAERAIQKGLLFRQRIESDLPPVAGEIAGYKLILNNLLDNAIKYTPSGSIQAAAWKADDRVCIEISDDGIGIPPGSVNNLFRRFYRTQPAIERNIAGVGLGLYMVKESLLNYNGSIEVKSTLGKGSVFKITLPVIQT